MKLALGLNVSVFPLTVVVPPAPLRNCPLRCALKTRIAPSVADPLLMGWLKVIPILVVAEAERVLRAGFREVTVGA
ncbi:hypothetical protein GCM10028807_14600 [Spirosoma daeguense]